MPLTIEEPIILQQVNWWRVRAIHLSLPLNAVPQCTIEVERGYDDGTAITPVEAINHHLANGDFAADFSTIPIGTSLYDAIKAVAYARLKADGVVPEDATEA